MSSFDSINEPLGRVLQCAQDIAFSCIRLFTNGALLDEIQRTHRDLPLFVNQTMKSFSGDKSARKELRHHLKAVATDTDNLMIWIGPEWERLEDERKAIGTVEDVVMDTLDFTKAKAAASTECQRRTNLVFDSLHRTRSAVTAICKGIDDSAKKLQVVAKDTVVANKVDPERDALLSKADAEQASLEQSLRTLKKKREDDEACRDANTRFARSIADLQLAEFAHHDPSPFPFAKFLPAIRERLVEVCQTLKKSGYENHWRNIRDRIEHRNLCMNQTTRVLNDTNFAWAKRLLDDGFANNVVLADIAAMWEKPRLRGGFQWLQILVNALLGEFRLDLLPEDASQAPNDLSAYLAELLKIEDEFFEAHKGKIAFGVSFWHFPENLKRLREADSRHGIAKNDSRVYSIAAYRRERETLETDLRRINEQLIHDPALNADWLRGEFRLTDCFARHFPGLSLTETSTVDSIPKLWAYIDRGIISLNRAIPLLVGRDTKAGDYLERLREVYGLMHEMRIAWTPHPPYPELTEQEAEHALRAIANRLETDDSHSAGARYLESETAKAKQQELAQRPEVQEMLKRIQEAAQHANTHIGVGLPPAIPLPNAPSAPMTLPVAGENAIATNAASLGITVDSIKKVVRMGKKKIEFAKSEVQWHILTVAMAAYPGAYSLDGMRKDYPGEDDSRSRKSAITTLNKKLASVGLRIQNRQLSRITDDK